jgi:RNA polymerase sigma factor (sigma-70 family)
MAHGPRLYETLRDLAGGRDLRSDAELIECFLTTRDEQAFGVLLGRHGPLVWGVCRRVLGRLHDAEDAFQATFLILARKAASIRRRTSLRCWLHGVALRVAVRAKAGARQQRQGPALDPRSADGPADAACAAELASVLDEEIRRLPERYRVPLVLCYLLGRTNEEAARELGWPKGTVAVRLARGRERLRRPLLRRGLNELAIAPVVPAGEQLPSELLTAARTTVASYRSGRLPPDRAHNLAKGAMKTMFYDRCKALLSILCSAGVLVGLGIGAREVLARTPPGIPAAGAAAQSPGNNVEPPRSDLESDAHFKDLLEQRRKAATVTYAYLYEQFKEGRGSLEILMESSEHLLKSDLELARTKADRIAARQAYLDRLKPILERGSKLYSEKRFLLADLKYVEYFTLDAEIELKRESAR